NAKCRGISIPPGISRLVRLISRTITTKPSSTIDLHSLEKTSWPEAFAVAGSSAPSFHLQGGLEPWSTGWFRLGISFSRQHFRTAFLSPRLEECERTPANFSGKAQKPGPIAVARVR